MNTYTDQDIQFILDNERGAAGIKAVALALFMFIAGSTIGFLQFHSLTRSSKCLLPFSPN